jgi:hypothetical protein
LIGLLLDLAFEPPAIALGLWTYNAGPISLHLGTGLRFPLVTAVAGCMFFGPLIAVRVLKDDKGQTLVERGLEHHSPRVRKGIALLALYGFVQFFASGPGAVPVMVGGLYQRAWAKLPTYLVNDACNAPGISGTRYGTCPGDPGFRMPGRQSRLPPER